MTDPGVSKYIVLRAARAMDGLDVVELGADEAAFTDHKAQMTTVEILPERVGRQALHRIARVYGIPVHWFSNPDMILDKDAGK